MSYVSELACDVELSSVVARDYALLEAPLHAPTLSLFWASAFGDGIGSSELLRYYVNGMLNTN